MARELRSRPRQGRSEATIDGILDAADAVFRTSGVADATTVLIARQAEMSVGRLYYWFADKEAIADALSSRHQGRLIDFLTSQLVDVADLPTPTLVRRIVDAFADFLRDNRGALALLRRSQPGGGVRELMVSLIAGMVGSRVPDAGSAEQHLVAAVLVETVVANLDAVLQAEDSTLPDASAVDSADLQAELAYLVAAYLYARYPSAVDPVWDSAQHPIRPAHAPATAVDRVEPIHPVVPTTRAGGDAGGGPRPQT